MPISVRSAIRICAAGSAAALSAATVLGLILSLMVAMSGREAPTLQGVLWFVGMSALTGTVVGVLPAAFVMALTPVRGNPWAAFPRVVVGAVLGFLLLALPLYIASSAPITAAIADAAAILGPTLGAVVAVYAPLAVQHFRRQ